MENPYSVPVKAARDPDLHVYYQDFYKLTTQYHDTLMGEEEE